MFTTKYGENGHAEAQLLKLKITQPSASTLSCEKYCTVPLHTHSTLLFFLQDEGNGTNGTKRKAKNETSEKKETQSGRIEGTGNVSKSTTIPKAQIQSSK